MKPNHYYLLAATVLIIGFPHALNVPIWATVAASVFIIWRLGSEANLLPKPNRWIVSSLVILISGAVFFDFRTFLDQEAGATLLLMLAALKLLEAKNYRDFMITLVLGIYLLMARLLFSQSLGSTLHLFLSILIILVTLFQVHFEERNQKSQLTSFKSASKLLLLTIPIIALFFLFFPRFNINLWRLNRKTVTSVGFSDKLEPGNIAQLVQSDETAFRVEFPQRIKLAPEESYWRGAILWTSNGMSWEKADPRPHHMINKSVLGRKIHTVTLEPHFNKWLFGLDVPVKMERNPTADFRIHTRAGNIYASSINLNHRIQYSVKSRPDHPDRRLNKMNRKVYTQHPTPSAKIVKLVESWKRQTNNDLELANIAMDYFANNDFSYTLTPGALKTRQIDEFLFEKKKGFCEHYAAVFATLLRMAGLPTRVVIGFHGGVKNDFGDYYIVKNRDAHAWSEVFLEGSGWTRFDPTSKVAPLRMLLGGQEYFSLDENQLANNDSRQLDQNDFLKKSGFDVIIQESSLFFDSVANRWNNFLLNYNFEFQKFLLEQLGFRGLNRGILIFIVSAIACLFILFLLYLQSKRFIAKDKLSSIIHKLNSKLEKAGVERSPTDGPLTLYKKSMTLTQKQPDLDDIFLKVIQLRYGDHSPSPDDLHHLEKQIKKLNLSQKKTA